jgi:hypothetical protein
MLDFDAYSFRDWSFSHFDHQRIAGSGLNNRGRDEFTTERIAIQSFQRKCAQGNGLLAEVVDIKSYELVRRGSLRSLVFPSRPDDAY